MLLTGLGNGRSGGRKVRKKENPILVIRTGLLPIRGVRIGA
jgi:hypothetical protein